MSYYLSAILNSYISTPAATECLIADTWYPVAGTFTRVISSGFEVVEDLVTYRGQPQQIQTTLTGSVQSSVGNNEVTLGLAINGVVPVTGEATIEVSHTSDTESIVVMTVNGLTSDDTLDAWVKSESVADITFTSMNAVVKPV